jgi:hypothetical protein
VIERLEDPVERDPAEPNPLLQPKIHTVDRVAHEVGPRHDRAVAP